MLNGLRKLLGQRLQNSKTNIQGAYNQVNPFDNGRTFADAWRARQPITAQPGVWSGQPRGDQRFIPYTGQTPASMPQVKTYSPNPAPQPVPFQNFLDPSLGIPRRLI